MQISCGVHVKSAGFHVQSGGFHVKSATKDQQLPGMVRPMFCRHVFNVAFLQ